ncbi:hypothetical protein QBC38DRAFT_483072 [Podospora fimiseda]|uniref:EthD domain-containing protein n=1 Tax=Podospora fimiseda TaxID=252190 RepID=A0AAN7BLG8_9PEZI|nr:hypothetical protein QBC38DRAFT_483072 [Podospora fimiseda]
MSTQLIKFNVCLYKKDDISHDDFVKWIKEDWTKKALPVLKEYGIVKFTLTTTPPCFREPFRQALVGPMGRPQWTVPDYDIVISYWLKSVEDLEKATKDPRWIELEEKEVLEKTNMALGHFVIGHESVVFGVE